MAKYKSLIIKQGTRVYLPMLIWSFPFVLLYLSDGGAIWKCSVLWICGGFTIYYFVALILQCYLLLPILQHFATLKGLCVSLIITLLSVSFICYVFFIKQIQVPVIFYGGPVTGSVVFFHLGIYLKKIESNVKFINAYKVFFDKYKLIFFCGCIFLVLLQYIETMCIMNYTEQIVRTGVKYTWVLYCCAIIFLLWSLLPYYKENGLMKLLARIGRLSFGIYLTHYSIMMILKELFPTVLEFNWGCTTLIVIVITYYFLLVLKKVTPPNLHRYLGLN